MMHTAQFVGTTQLQQEPSVITNVSITMSVDHTPLYPSILSNVCVEVSQRTVDSLALTLQKASLISSTNSRYSALEFGPYNCCKRSECPNSFNLNVHILPASRIHSSTVCQLRVCKNTPPPAWEKLAQRRSSRVSTHRPAQQHANNIQGISFSLLNHSMLFHCD